METAMCHVDGQEDARRRHWLLVSSDPGVLVVVVFQVPWFGLFVAQLRSFLLSGIAFVVVHVLYDLLILLLALSLLCKCTCRCDQSLIGLTLCLTLGAARVVQLSLLVIDSRWCIARLSGFLLITRVSAVQANRPGELTWVVWVDRGRRFVFAYSNVELEAVVAHAFFDVLLGDVHCKVLVRFRSRRLRRARG